LQGFTTEQIAALATDDLRALNTAQLRSLDSSDLAAITSDQAAALTSAQIGSLTGAQIVGIATEAVASFVTSGIRALSTAAVAALTTDQVVGLGTQQVEALTSTQIAALNTAQIQALETADFALLSTTQLRSLSSTQIAAIETDDFRQLGSNDIAALTTQQIDGVTTDQIVALTTDQIVGFETADLASMNMDQVLAFSSDQTAAMNSQQINALFLATPIMLDLDGNGIQTVSASQGVRFDLLGDGQTAQWGWAAGNDGFLVMDRNNDGQINDGKELFGSGTRLADGSRAADGFAAMAAEDSNKDGKLDASDANWSKLQVWVDADKDGVTDAGELKSLAELGITSFDLGAAKGTELNNGNFVGLVSKYTKDDGSTHQLADVWFAKDTTPPALGDVVAAAPDELPLPEVSPTAAAAASTAATRVDMEPMLGVQDAPNQRHIDLPPQWLVKSEEDDSFKPPLI
jgi:hypothetical protein